MIKMYAYCSFCGSDQLQQNSSYHDECFSCKKINFVNLACTGGCYLIDSEGNVGLAKRAHEPRKGKYDDAGGFVDRSDLSCEDAIIRELEEELGITLDKDQLHYLTSHAMIYPFQGRDTPVMAMLFYAYITDSQKQAIQVNDDVDEFLRVNSNTFQDEMMCSSFQSEQVRKILDMGKI